jgi:hypothetical protein
LYLPTPMNHRCQDHTGEIRSLPKEELNRYAVVFANPSSSSQDKPFPLLIQSGFFIGSC